MSIIVLMMPIIVGFIGTLVKQIKLAQSSMSVRIWVKRLNRMNSELQEGMRGAKEVGE